MAEDVSFIDPEILAKISSLKLRALDLVEGLLTGQHKSRHKGSSIEFSEYKDYSPGDEIRHIDWKVVGKTDKYHVKQFEQSTNLKCTLLLDASGSMGYESSLISGASKMEYAQLLVSSLGYLLLKQFDAVGLTAFNDRVVQHIPPRSKASHIKNILHAIATLRPEGNTRIDSVLAEIIERLPARSLLILVSDLLSPDYDLQKNLKLLRSRKLEVILFQILHPDEVDLPFQGEVVFESLEDDPPIGVDPRDIRESYREAMRKQIETNKKICSALGVDYLFLQTATPLEQALSYFLLRRNRLCKQ